MKAYSLRLTAAFVFTGIIGWLDYVTGVELDLFVLYLLPIVWVGWTLGSRAGIAVAVEGTALWYFADVYLLHAYTHPIYGVWGAMVKLVAFAGAALASNRIHRLLKRERQLNHKLADALARVKKLSGRLPICIGCKSIRDEGGHWHEIEEYFTVQSEDDFVFSQTVCPHCRELGSNGAAKPANQPNEPVLMK